MGSGCEILIAGLLPSSARQLPILAALHARASTLFGPIIHHEEQKVNTFFEKYRYFFIERTINLSLRASARNFPWQSPEVSGISGRLPRHRPIGGSSQ